MSTRDEVAAGLLALGILAYAVSTLGLFLSRNVYNRLHAGGVANIVTTLCVTAAFVVEKLWSQAGIKAILIGLVFLIGSPILNHAIGRAAHTSKET
jgi:monovalent cation/proton antiporter MnhG/PhaG subunit